MGNETSLQLRADLRSDWILKDSSLAVAGYAATRDDGRVMDAAVLAYRAHPESWPWVSFSSEMVFSLFEEIGERGSRKKALTETLERLRGMGIKIRTPGGAVGQITIMPEWWVFDSQVFLRFSDESEPLLRTFASRPVGYRTSENRLLSGAHAPRILEWVREAIPTGTLDLTVDEIRFRLRIPNDAYARDSMMIQRVVEQPSKSVTESTPFQLSVETLRTGKTVTCVRILIDHKGPDPNDSAAWKAVEELHALGVGLAEAKMICADQDAAIILKCIERVALSPRTKDATSTSVRQELMAQLCRVQFPVESLEPTYCAEEADVISKYRDLSHAGTRRVELLYRKWLTQHKSKHFVEAALPLTGLDLNSFFCRRAFVACYSDARNVHGESDWLADAAKRFPRSKTNIAGTEQSRLPI